MSAHVVSRVHHRCADELPQFMDGLYTAFGKIHVEDGDIIKCSCGRYYRCDDAMFKHYTRLSRRQVLKIYRARRRARANGRRAL